MECMRRNIYLQAHHQEDKSFTDLTKQEIWPVWSRAVWQHALGLGVRAAEVVAANVWL